MAFTIAVRTAQARIHTNVTERQYLSSGRCINQTTAWKASWIGQRGWSYSSLSASPEPASVQLHGLIAGALRGCLRQTIVPTGVTDQHE
jgi:hypothetical protein